jgi:hypothetical protein
MPRKRTPSPEQLVYDKQIIEGCAVILAAVGARHGSEKLRLAAELANNFVDAPTAQPKPRTRKPKAAPLVVEMPHEMADVLRRGSV